MSYYLSKLRREISGIQGYEIGGSGSKSTTASESAGQSDAQSSSVQNATSDSNQVARERAQSAATSSSSGFSGISDSDTLSAISKLIANEGMSSDLARQTVEKGQQKNLVLSQLSNFTQNKAFENSTDAMSAALRTLSEHSGSAIARAVDSAGTSGGSMEALLANDANARNAGAAAGIGVDLASKYGGITADILNNASGLSTIDTTSINSLLEAIDKMKTSTNTSISDASSGSTSDSVATSQSREGSLSQSTATSRDEASSQGKSKSASFKLF